MTSSTAGSRSSGSSGPSPTARSATRAASASRVGGSSTPASRSTSAAIRAAGSSPPAASPAPSTSRSRSEPARVSSASSTPPVGAGRRELAPRRRRTTAAAPEDRLRTARAGWSPSRFSSSRVIFPTHTPRSCSLACVRTRFDDERDRPAGPDPADLALQPLRQLRRLAPPGAASRPSLRATVIRTSRAVRFDRRERARAHRRQLRPHVVDARSPPPWPRRGAAPTAASAPPVRVEHRVEDQPLVALPPGAVERVEPEQDRVAGAERLVDDRGPARELPGAERVLREAEALRAGPRTSTAARPGSAPLPASVAGS